ncbi:GxxExxY protein [Sulfuriroseicoccus oceanibius]|uniref:GxxExxY protein n=1 Tax=Sulfuriroseicoccus oceanibius TaxID=2707525 RepID=A0A7T7JCZ4_9BACT|nr:GxxExxY protein [Sulfuriroseicoccus oceanibius]QQL45521.1 GxxExxY protein [Sulfuriroseicoccus oceanibius]
MSRGDPESYAVIGAAMEVQNHLGRGYLERAYQEALEIEFIERKIPYQREVAVTLHYKGRQLGAPYRADFVCYGSLLVELKAIPRLGDRDRAQMLHYLKGTKIERGLLINFASDRLEYERYILS